MKAAPIVSITLGVAAFLVFTSLLVVDRLSGATYLGTLALLALVCLVIPCLPRLLELDLRNLRMTLSELRQVKSEIETVKAGIEEMYGGIENLRRAPFVLDGPKMAELGLSGGSIATAGGAMRYTAGCIRRERERLAKVFVTPKAPDKLAEAILDNSLDEKVFKWNGPEAILDAPPTSLAERERKKQERSDQST
ncbi:MAG: hypothetical protein WC869_11280 [Phycisphaerae bacterium]|jgi:hypothetical protein